MKSPWNHRKKFLNTCFMLLGVMLLATGCGNAAKSAGQSSEETEGKPETLSEEKTQGKEESQSEKSVEEKNQIEQGSTADKPEETGAQETEGKESETGAGGGQNNSAKEIETVKNGDYIVARPSVSGKLAVKGTQLVNEKGEPVQLRGISTHGIAWFPDYVNQACFEQLGDEFGANLIRLAMYTDENGGYCVDGDKEKLKALILSGVQYAKEADMYVIVDWHILHDNNPLMHKDEAMKFFEEITEKLKDEKHIIYEICNEPNGGTEWADIKAYAGEVLPIIRKNAPDAVVLIGTPTWSQEIDKAQNDPITGFDNIMYTVHFYAATHKEDLRKKMTDAILAGTPVFVSEFGLCDASGNGGNDLLQAQEWIDVMNQYGISYAAWSLSNKNETSALILSSCQKTSGFSADDLSESGKWIYEMLRAGGKTGDDGGKASQKESEAKNEKSGDSDSAQKNESAQKETEQPQNAKQTSSNDDAGQQITSGNLEICAKVTGSWESEGKTFYQYQLTVKNKGQETVSAWEISLDFSETITLSDGWNGDYKQDGKKLTISSKDYNKEIAAGGTVTDIGFIVSASDKLTLE